MLSVRQGAGCSHTPTFDVHLRRFDVDGRRLCSDGICNSKYRAFEISLRFTAELQKPFLCSLIALADIVEFSPNNARQ